ncbi:GerAB/ArcD/ProY family transporter [Calidifontibacillus erzurumensis]|uniref:GerAB/ArcD/ProY family transporter n=1 Tax=Calidifontibacillus erzurumensis TaxID=2741433 RepID=UPI0035B51E3C
MIDKGKISAFQLAMMMIPTIFATGILLVPAITVKHAKQDLWISPIWASVIGFFLVYILYQLHEMYPNKSLIEYSEILVGKMFGKLIGFIYVVFYLHINGIIIREYAEFVVGTFLVKTPIFVVMGMMILVCAISVYGGIEVLGRMAEIILPFVVFFFFFIIITLLKDLDYHQIFPIFGYGIKPSLLGSIVPQGWYSEFLLVSFLFPFVHDRQNGLKFGMFSVVSVTILLVIVNLAAYMLYGKLTGAFTYPIMVAVRYVSIGDFFEHLEAIVMAIWVAGTFIKISVFFYINVISISQWLKLSDYKPLVLPTAFLLVLLGWWSATSLEELSNFLGTTGAFYLISFQTLIPLFLFCLAKFRNHRKRKKGDNGIEKEKISTQSPL